MDEYEEAVRSTGRPLRQAKKTRQAHIDAVLAALRAGKRPTDVASWSPFTAAYIRKLARGAGIPPATPGAQSDPG
jgi:hypothetical protein